LQSKPAFPLKTAAPQHTKHARAQLAQLLPKYLREEAAALLFETAAGCMTAYFGQTAMFLVAFLQYDTVLTNVIDI
jgi:hypothetical protein